VIFRQKKEGGAPADYEAIQDTFKVFLREASKGNTEAAANHWVEAGREGFVTGMGEMSAFARFGLKVQSPKLAKIRVDGDRATGIWPINRAFERGHVGFMRERDTWKLATFEVRRQRTP
jgi:hypothetical protein